jgi:hypothetical protein
VQLEREAEAMSAPEVEALLSFLADYYTIDLVSTFFIQTQMAR